MATTYEKGRASVENLANRAQDKVSGAARDAGDAVGEYANRAQEQLEKSIHQYPLATVAGAAALGLLVGMALRR